jgi:hypothetical protein
LKNLCPVAILDAIVAIARFNYGPTWPSASELQTLATIVFQPKGIIIDP